MNQILVTEKLYVTPEIKRKKLIYKLEFFLSVFLICFLFSYYISAEYDRNSSELISHEILAQIKYEEDPTIKKEDVDVLVVVLNKNEEEPESTETVNNNENIDTNVYTASDGVEYTTESVLEIPKIGIKYPVLSTTSPALLNVSINKYWGPNPNEVGNYCIVGHNTTGKKIFGRLNTLVNGDIAKLTDLTGRTITYQVYQKYIVKPTDTRCTSQLTNGKKELTLITCTNGTKQRLVLKLREVSD